MTTSCSEDTIVERSGAATLRPTVTVDPSLITGSSTLRAVTSAPSAEEMAFTLSADDGKYDHTWASVNDYPLNELLQPGIYTATASYGSENDEGIGRPYFSGSQKLNLQSGAEAECNITATLISALFQTEIPDNLTSSFTEACVTYHSEGHSYIRVTPDEVRAAYLHPGKTDIIMNLTDATGNEANIRVSTIDPTESRHLYDVRLESDGLAEPTVTIFVNGKETGKKTITEKLMKEEAPAITPQGFASGTPVNLPEGTNPTEALSFSISDTPCSSLILTTMAPSLTEKGWPAQIDLANASEDELRALETQGLAVSRHASGEIKSIDLSRTAALLRYSKGNSVARFILAAEGTNGKLSEPCELQINLQPVEISVVSASDIMIGVNAAEITVLSRSGDLKENLVIEARNDNETWQSCRIDAIEPRNDGEYAIRFTAPEGSTEKVDVRIIYCGNVLTETSMKRTAPKFNLAADAFAMSATLKITSENEKMIPLITSLARIYVNGEQAISLRRVPESGTIYVGNLSPKQPYTLTATMFDKPTAENMTAPVEIRTENTAGLQNSDFEDHATAIKYDNLPQGGLYSQSIIDIFNRQNYTSFKLDAPSYWTTVNAKTFCTQSTNPNTWYMAPSAYSEVDNVEGYFAVKLQSVAWDNTGEQITPYRQKPDSYLAYNPNIPNIKYRAAGKVFLGGYSFNPETLEENYYEGIEFTSRPAAVNGNYHFTPSPTDLNDCAKVTVEVCGIIDGQEKAIASNSMELPAALTYTAFTVPLSYKYFGVKATRLKIMLSSSKYTGTIEYESSKIKTYSDPEKATSIGGQLWVEDLQLSYF